MKFEIRNVRNGVVLIVDPALPETLPEEIVYQDIDGADVEAFADFLRHVLDNYGPTTSRYSSKRIHVIVEPGDKYEGGSEEAAT